MNKAESIDPFWNFFVRLMQQTNSLYGWHQQSTEDTASPLGFLPLDKLVAGKFALSGVAPAWLLPAEAVQKLKDEKMLSLFGKTTEYLFDGELLVTCHYLDEERKAALEALFGTPNTGVEQFMLSSGRSVLLSFRGRVLCFKFCGKSVKILEQKVDRSLSAEKVASTIRVNQNLAGEQILAENFGFSLRFKDSATEELAVLYRDYDYVNIVRKDDDTLIPAFTLFSKLSPRLKTLIFGAKEHDIEGWMKQNFVPALTGLICSSFFESGYHLELHQQNLSLLINDGKIRKIFYQDSCDLLEDVLYRYLVLKRSLSDVAVKRTYEFPAAGEYSTIRTKTFNSNLSFWYRFFLQEFGLYEQALNVNLLESSELKYDLFGELSTQLQEKFREHLAKVPLCPPALELKELTIAFAPGQNLFKVLNAFRDLLIKDAVLRMEKTGNPDKPMAYGNFFKSATAEQYFFFTYGVDFSNVSDLMLKQNMSTYSCSVGQGGAEFLILQDQTEKSTVHIVAKLCLPGVVKF